MTTTLKMAESRYPGAEAFAFGDSRELSDSLVALVRSGRKRATCAASRCYGFDKEPMPVVGTRYIVVSWDRSPEFAIELTEVELRRFCDIDADFALSEGEDTTLEGWQLGHRAFFERDGGWQNEMELVCQRFEVIEDFRHSKLRTC